MSLEFLKNRFAEIFHKNKITAVYIKDVKEKRLHVVFPNGKEELINFAALIYFEEKSNPISDINQILPLLKEKQENREKIKNTFNLKELWEVLNNEVEEISAKSAVELILGKIPSEDEVAAFIRKILEEGIYFKLEKPNFLSIMSSFEVEKILFQKEKELERIKKIDEGENFIKALCLGNVNSFTEEIKNFWISALKNYVIWESNAPSGKIIYEALKRLNLTDPYKVFELLVKNGYLSEDENLELLRTHYPMNFSEKEEEETKEILKISISKEKREDLTSLYTFTVDAEETQDFDDALSFEEKENEYILYVHITEVADYIKPGSSLWEGALERACTLYLPDAIYPMLPFSLSHEKFSLKKGHLKPALTFKIVIDKNYNLISFEPFLSLITVKQRLTYNEVDELLFKNSFWQKIYEILMHFKKRREQKGAIAVFLPEIQVKVTSDRRIIVKKIEMTPSRMLIAEAMILVNTLSAEFLYQNQIPAIYRSQPKPLEIIQSEENNLYFKLLQLKFLAKSELSLQPAYHSGLGLDYYTTLTSPIRRFLDLLIQYQLKQFLLGNLFLSEKDLNRILPELIENLQRSLQIQNKRERYFLLKYLKLYLKDEPLRGLVLDIQSKKAKIYLIDFNIVGEITNFKENLSLGDEIKVKIEKVNPHLDLLRLKIA